MITDSYNNNSPNDILISKPYLLQTDNDKIRLCSLITINNRDEVLYLETDNTYTEYLDISVSDCFLIGLLPLALMKGYNIICQSPVSEQLLHNVRNLLILCLSKNKYYQSITVIADHTSGANCGNAVATACSGGVDSFYSILQYHKSQYPDLNLTHLYVGNLYAGNYQPRNGKIAIIERAKTISDSLRLPLIITDTNLSEVFYEHGSKPHIMSHFYKTMFGIIALKKLIKTYIYSTSYNISSINIVNAKSTGDYGLLSAFALSYDSFQVILCSEVSRNEKTIALKDFEIAHQFLHVCLDPSYENNCNICEKCKRTLLALDMYNMLDLFSHVFDVDYYRTNKSEYITYLIQKKENKHYTDLYQYFLNREPELIELCEKGSPQ